jgi:hypothetical protein
MPAQELTKTDEEKMVDLDVSGPAVDVELPQEGAVISEVAEEAETPEVQVESAEEPDKTEELENYSKNVKRRIDKLTAKLREAERREQAATTFAESVKKENEGLKTRNSALDGNYIVEFANRITTETEAAKEQLRQATQNDEVDKQVEAQQKLARLAVEAQNLKNLNEQRKMQADKTPAPTTLNQVFENNVANETPAPPDPKAEAWAAKNDWFGKDAAMTMTSFVHHRQLTEEEGFDGTEDEYYDEIDKRMRAEFPHKFGDAVPQEETRPAQTVASATRSPKRGRGKNTVRLTPSQVAIAKKLGVPLEEYARHVKE